MRKLNGRMAKEVEDLRKMRDADIDLSDTPEKGDWNKAVRGKFCRPVKESLTGLPPHPSKLRQKTALKPK